MGLRQLFGPICLCLVVVSLRAQHGAGEYDRRWAVVDSLFHRAGLPESALAEVNRIDALAQQEHNSAQEIRALIYRLTIQQQKNDLDDTAAIRLIEKRVVGAAEPVRSILESLLARLYWSYLQRNRYKLYNRTAIGGGTAGGAAGAGTAGGGTAGGAAGAGGMTTDITTWTMDDFYRRIGELYLASVKEEGLLERTGLNEWDPILIKGNSRRLRPTLYDILAHEALGFFSNQEASINRPAAAYTIDDPAAFADAAVFAVHVFRGTDTSSPHYQALLLYQRLLRFHLGDTQPDALIDADIDRLGFVTNYSVDPEKDSLYAGALKRVTDRWGDNPAAAQAWYLRARQDTDRVRAKAICERVLQEPDSSEGKMNCRILLNDIVRPTLAVDVEQFNVPGKPFRCLVSWSNLNRVYVRLVRIDSAMRKTDGMDWTIWLQAPVYRSFSQDLPAAGDYQTHAAEIAIGSLPPGPYGLLTSSDPSWDAHKGVVMGHRIYVTSIAYLHEGRDYWVVNRESGQPLNDTRVQVWNRHWNSQDIKWQDLIGETYHTDQQGHFRVNIPHREGRYFFEFQRPGENLYLTDLNGPYYFGPEPDRQAVNKEDYENKNTSVFFFLDRSIYRPGQLVYFKGISVTRDYDTRQLKPIAGRKAVVELFNANREMIDSLQLTTDEFGAYHGVFHLPDHGLNGQFEMADEVGHTFIKYFNVEEYKRPRFYVNFDRLKGGYRVGDSIRIKGSAIAYAGNNLDGATVRFRVTRLARYQIYRYSDRRRLFPQNRQEIAHGVLKTEANGDFRLVFDALPDRSIPVASDPRFEYQVEADVTDINGETRSGSTTIVAGYTVLDLSIGLADGAALLADSLRSVRVDVSNLSGETVESMVHVAAYPLKAPDRLIRERLWTTVPDRWVMSESSFIDSFPHDQYREELKKETWPRGAAVWEGVDSTGGHPMPLRLGPGWWVIEATTTDSFGGVAKDLRYIELDDNQTGGPVNPEYLWAGRSTGKQAGSSAGNRVGGSETRVTGEPGGAVRVETGSSAKDIFIVREVQRPGEDTTGFHWLAAASGRTIETWPIREADRGGFGVGDNFVKDNRLYVHRTIVEVPWDNKELQIHYTSFRDRTEPGSKEKWAVSISGWRGSRVAAQVLTAMYDSSLDQFRSQTWTVPNLYLNMGAMYAWQMIDDFRTSRSYLLGPSGLGNKYKAMAPAGEYLSAAVIPDDQEERKVGEGAAPVLMGAAPQAPPVQVRSNFKETAFFYPDLRTDSSGSVSFSFTMPESLTRWKWMMLAHTRDLAFGYSERTIVTQKQLMVQPNVPRFLREGDKINLSVKVVNLTDSEMTGQMGLALTDPTTGEPADGWFINRQPNQYFTVPAHGSSVVEFPLDIPYQYNRPLSYRVVAQAGAYSDGEEAVLPVVSNRMLVTETLPLNMTGDGVRSFKFEKLLQSGSSETLNHHALTVEFTANPAWDAVEALPYLMEYPYECAEQTFDRLYSNAVASKIVRGSPRIAQVFASWRTVDTSALLSNLEKNQELKSVLLEETPWVLEGKTETQQKKNIALLFDLTRLTGQLESTVDQLHELQAADGGFPWFKGGQDDRYVTQYILTGLGRLQRMQALSPVLDEKIKNMIMAALGYADREITKDYQQDLKVTGGVHWISPFAAQYLYMRSLFNDYGIPGGSFPAVNFYRKVAQQEWVKAGKYVQGMVALALFRTGDVVTARAILASLRETAIRDEELGMYWKGMEGGYYWYQAPVETSALMIEAFREIGHDTAADRQLKTWLLRQKQTHRWATTKATTDAVYALLMGGMDWLDQRREVKVQLGDKEVEVTGEAGTGYFSKIFDAPFINPSMGTIKVSMSSVRGGGSPAWGAVYWQYFDQLDQITPAEGGGGAAGAGKAPLRVEKRLFIQRNTDRGPVLDTIPDNGTLHVGDRVVVRLVLRSDRDLEYVHLKDMRGACLEPVNVLSRYRWQGGLGYYESTKDVSSEFFFPRVPKGVYVFEYPLVVEQTGEFSNGVASVECMYAPEFAFHTEGIRINVEGGQ